MTGNQTVVRLCLRVGEDYWTGRKEESCWGRLRPLRRRWDLSSRRGGEGRRGRRQRRRCNNPRHRQTWDSVSRDKRSRGAIQQLFGTAMVVMQRRRN